MRAQCRTRKDAGASKGRNTEESTIRWLCRRHEKEGMNGIGTRDLEIQTTVSSRYSHFANTLQEIVWENNKEINKEGERKASVVQPKWYKKTSRGKRRGKAGEVSYAITSEKKEIKGKE